MPNKQVHIAIVGCGIAGLACAIALSRQGIRVSLFEKFVEPKPVGAGILLQPSGLLALEQLGLLDSVASLSDPIHCLLGDDINAGRIMDVHYNQIDVQRYGYNYGLGVHRGNLFKQLLAKAKSVGCLVYCDHDVQAVHRTKDVYRLQAEHGDTISEADAVIIANGSHSKLRQNLPVKQSFSPYPWGALWAILPDPEQRFTDQLVQRYAAANIMVGMLPTGVDPVSKQHCVSFFWSLPNVDYQKWQKLELSDWKYQVLACWPELESALESLTSHKQLAFARYGRVSMKAYHDDGIICVGDAAHGMSPQLGQGANLALIDAVCLADCVADNESIERAFSQYTLQRQSHIRFYDYASWLLTPLFQSNSRVAPWLRNKLFPLLNALPYSQHQALKTVSGFKTGLFFDKTIL